MARACVRARMRACRPHVSSQLLLVGLFSLVDATVQGCLAEYYGAGIAAGGALAIHDGSHATVVRSTFLSNRAAGGLDGTENAYGGAIEIYDSSTAVSVVVVVLLLLLLLLLVVVVVPVLVVLVVLVVAAAPVHLPSMAGALRHSL